MGFLEWFSAPPVRPILLRLDLGGAPCPPFVEIEAQWFPVGEHVQTTLISSASMALLPWRGKAERAALTVRAGGREGRAEVTRESNRAGEVFEVKLAP